MSANSKQLISNDSEGQVLDDLTVIVGIGKARAAWLRDSLNVYTFRDLATLSADEIESRLRAEGKVFSRGEINRWIAEATDLAGRDRPLWRVDQIGPAERAKHLPDPSKWSSIAAFIVDLQTRRSEKGGPIEQRITVQHIPVAANGTWLEEEIEKSPTEIEGEHLYQWIRGQVTERRLEAVEDKDMPSEFMGKSNQSMIAPEINIQVSQIRAFQPSMGDVPVGMAKAGEMFQGVILGNQPFDLESSFLLSGPSARELIREALACRVRCYASDRQTGERIHLGDTATSSVISDKLDYRVRLVQASLPPGLYRLQIIAELIGTFPAVGFLEIPLVQVLEPQGDPGLNAGP